MSSTRNRQHRPIFLLTKVIHCSYKSHRKSDTMFLHHVLVTYLGCFLPVSLSHEILLKSKFSSTENEFEFDYRKGGRAKESESSLFVGGFQLAAEDDFTHEACDHIENQFQLRTDCTCNLSMLHSSTVQFGCKNKHLICNQQEYCAQPVYTGTVGYETPALSSAICLNNLQKDSKHYGNLCITIDGLIINDTDMNLRRCRAQVDKRKCSCTICGDGSGVRVDCTDIDSELISRNCDSVGRVTTIRQLERKIEGFFPSFQ